MADSVPTIRLPVKTKKKATFAIDVPPPISKDPGYTNNAPSLKSPRSARFAEATAVNSPVDGVNPFADPRPKTPHDTHQMAQTQVADVGFGYINRPESVQMPDTDNNDYPKTPLRSPGPLKSALKIPGAPPREYGVLMSPTFREDEELEKHEKFTEKIQAQDLRVKTRVRIARFFLRGVNFSCSLIVLSMLSSTFAIFRATKSIPPRNNLPPWAQNQMVWPQVVLLCIACISLLGCLIIFWQYWRGGHKRAKKSNQRYQWASLIFFSFSLIMWLVGGALLQHAKNTHDNKDMWGWSCADTPRKHFFQNEINYNLLCRLQNWSLVCAIIEVVVEVLAICVYGIVFYRFYSKRKLRQTMDNRDRARSDVYIAQLKSQSQPNTPAPFSPRDGGFRPDQKSFFVGPAIEEGIETDNENTSVQYVNPDKRAAPKPFALQPAPAKGNTPRIAQVGFQAANAQNTSDTAPLRSPSPPDTIATTTTSQQLHPYHTQQTQYANYAQSISSPRGPPTGNPLSPSYPIYSVHSPQYFDAPPNPSVEQRQDHFEAADGEELYEAVPIPGAYETPMSPGHAPPMSPFTPGPSGPQTPGFPFPHSHMNAQSHVR